MSIVLTRQTISIGCRSATQRVRPSLVFACIMMMRRSGYEIHSDFPRSTVFIARQHAMKAEYSVPL